MLRLTLILSAILLSALLLIANPQVARADGPFISPSGGTSLTVFCLFASGFKPYETVALWVQHENGDTESAGYALATGEGKLGHAEGTVAGYACTFGLPGWPSGETLFVARGLASHHEASAKFLFTSTWAEAHGTELVVKPVPAAPIDTPVFSFEGSGFKPYERFSAWLGFPDGSTFVLWDNQYADAQGKTISWIYPSALPGPGDYIVVHRSVSGVELSAHFTYSGIPDPLPAENKARVNPDNGTYQTQFNIHGAGFRPYEPVAVWVGEPNGNVFDLGTQYADGNGVVSAFWVSYPGEPFGTYTVELRGLQTHLALSTKFEVHPIPLNP